MNENTKIITNLAIAIMKKQKRERLVREKDQRTSQSPSPSPVQRGGEGSLVWRGDEGSRTEASPTASQIVAIGDLKRRQWSATWSIANGAESLRSATRSVTNGELNRCQSSPTKLNRRDRWAEAVPLSLIGDGSAPSATVELNRQCFNSIGVGICNGKRKHRRWA